MALATRDKVISEDARIRQRVLETAVAILTEQGMIEGLLMQAAVSAGYPIERVRVFFRRDEEMILALYSRLAAELEARVAELPDGSIGDRFRAIMLAKLSIVTPYREALGSLMAAMLDPRSELGILSAQTEVIRNRVSAVFRSVVLGASDKPNKNADLLTRNLYGAHLLLMLLWTQDQSDDSSSTRAAIDLASNLFSMSSMLAWMPQVKSNIELIDQISAAFVEPTANPQDNAVASKILQHIFKHRRLQPGAGGCALNPCDSCFALHLPKVRRFVANGESVHLLLPAFPAKSPNPRKVAGDLPDMAEEQALRFLQTLAEEIRGFYPPGIRITICSDGHVFSDLVNVADENVTKYGQGVSQIIERCNLSALETFSLEDLYELPDPQLMRERLCKHYAQSTTRIRERVENFEGARALFNGIQRFIFEDRIAVEPGRSRTSVRNECKDVTYQVIQRSEAWGRLIADCFPASIRLSIHPQFPHSEKIGILLGDADDAWLTPWHSVAVKQNGKFRLMQRHAAEEIGARFVEDPNGSHYFEIH